MISILQYQAHRNDKWLILTGLACGLKLTCLLVCICVYFYALFRHRDRIFRGGIYLAMLFLLGFLIFSPSVVISPVDFYKQIFGVATSFNSWPVEWYFNPPVLPLFWEGGTYGSLFYWFGCGWVFFVLLVFGTMVNRELGIIVISSFVLTTLFVLTQPIHNWYGFPVLVLSILLFADSQLTSWNKRIVATIFLVLLCTINFSLSYPLIKEELNYKKINSVLKADVLSTMHCIEAQLINKDINRVLDMGTIGYSVPLTQEVERLNYHDSYVEIGNLKLVERSGDLYIFGKRARVHPQVLSVIEKAIEKNQIVETCGDIIWVYIQ